MSFRLRRAALPLLLALLSLPSLSVAQETTSTVTNPPIALLDDNLSYWYKWIGVPHRLVQGLPPGTPVGDGMHGVPLGRNDPLNVFQVVTLDGEKVLRASGEIYGGLTTKAQYQNYHFHLQYKWGSKKWSPRLHLPRDGGILFHLTGTNEDAYWSVFMMGMEFQVSQGTVADVLFMPNKDSSLLPEADARGDVDSRWDATKPLYRIGGHGGKLKFHPRDNFESALSDWTTLDLYTVGNSNIYMVNGHVASVFQNPRVVRPDGTTMFLTKGKLQLQSEGAELYYKDISIQPIDAIPDDIKKSAGLP